MTLEYKGQTLGFQFGLYFLGKAQTWMGFSDLNDLLKSVKMRADIVDLMYYSVKSDATRKELPFIITKDEWITSFENDEIDVNKIVEFEEAFVESINGIFGLNKEDETKEDSEPKKK